MSASIQIELVDSAAGTFVFDVDGEFIFSQDSEYQESSDPPVLSRIVETWRINNARIVAANSEAVFDEWLAFQAKVESRTGTRFVGARIKRDGNIEKVLGGSSSQQFRIEATSVQPDIEVPKATFNTVVPVSMTLVAVQSFDSGGNENISNFSQTVSNTYRNGLHTLEWRTTITTPEGTDARESVKVVGKIPIDLFGNTYTWDTNGPDGIDFDYEDADESTTSLTPNHIPTEVTSVSRIRQWGVTIGTPSSGNSINGEIVLEIETRVNVGKRSTTTRAAAEGPGCENWVADQRPTLGKITSSVFSHDQAGRVCSAEWVVATSSVSGEGDDLTQTTSTVLSSGGLDISFVQISGDRPPKKVVGSRSAFRLVVTFNSKLTTEIAGREQMPLPDPPGEPWVYIQNESHEDAQPRLVEEGAELSGNKWERGCVLVYESPTKPDNVAIDSVYTATSRLTHMPPRSDV